MSHATVDNVPGSLGWSVCSLPFAGQAVGRTSRHVWSLDRRSVPVRAAVRDPDHTPYVVSSADSTLTKVLYDEWPHELLLSTLPA